MSPQRKRIGYRFLSAARASTRLRLACRDALYRLRGSPDGLPIPPAALHVLVSGNARLGVAEYFEVGRLCADTLETLLRVWLRARASSRAFAYARAALR